MFNLVSRVATGMQRIRTYRRQVLTRRQIEGLPEDLRRDIGWPRDVENPTLR